MNKICGYACEHNKGGVCQITYCDKIGEITITTHDNCGIKLYEGDVDTTTGKIILNGVEIIDTESWYEAINTFTKLETELEEKDKEITRLNKENNDLRKLYQRTYKHLFDIGNDELARYFQAQIDECPTFYVEPIVDYYEECKRLNNIIEELEKELNEQIEEGRSEDHLWLMGYYDASKNYLNRLKELKGENNE